MKELLELNLDKNAINSVNSRMFSCNHGGKEVDESNQNDLVIGESENPCSECAINAEIIKLFHNNHTYSFICNALSRRKGINLRYGFIY